MKTSFIRQIATALTLVLAAASRLAFGADIDPVLVGSWHVDPPSTLDQPALAISGNHAYVVHRGPENPNLHVIDISKAAQPQLLGSSLAIIAGTDLAVSGNHVLVTGLGLGPQGPHPDGLWVFDVSNPASPRLAGSYTVDFNSAEPTHRRVAVSGHHAYVTSGPGPVSVFDLSVFDISDPASPKLVGGDSLGESPFWAPSVAVSGHHAYLTEPWGSGHAGLRVFDVSDPATPKLLGSSSTSDEEFLKPGDVQVSGNYAYLVGTRPSPRAGGSWLMVIDVSNPGNPRALSRTDGLSKGLTPSPSVAVSGNYAYVVGGLHVFDVSNPANPQRLGGNSAIIGFIGDVAVSQPKVLVTADTAGLAIYEMPPYIKSIAKEGSNVKLDWEGFGPARLQRATQITNPDWKDLIGSENTNRVTLPMWSGPEFFRLVRP